jgi:vacuolar-type H+-ATPase subunit H
MTSTSHITDIHAAETKVAKRIEETKTQNQSKIASTKENKANMLVELEAELKTAGNERLTQHKAHTSKKAEASLKEGKENNASMMKVAEAKISEATKHGVAEFKKFLAL